MDKNERVLAYNELKRKPDSDKALTLLKRLASQVKPILKNRNWTIKNLCEFFPTNPNLLGVNVNRGWKINLRLRPHFDESQFLEYEEILGTLLHEMAHIVRGPHDAQFYKLLEELKRETEDLIVSGYSGEGFFSTGHNLGSRSVPRYLSKQAAADAAEKRQHLSRLCPPGGVRLGGGGPKNMTPAQLAAMAAEKRLQDKIWCGGSIVENEVSSPNSPIASPSSSSNTKRKLNVDDTTGETQGSNALKPGSKKTRVTIDLTNDDGEDENGCWTCTSCTYINNPLILACEVCLSERPIENDTPSKDNDYWTCPKCTLENEKKWMACTACSFIQLK